MRILAFSDLHLNLKAARILVEESKMADLVIGAGDFATRQSGLVSIIDILKAIDKPTLLVPGNHDDFIELMHVCENWPSAEILHGRGINIAGINFFGVGYETPRSCFESWNRYLSEEEAHEMLATCQKGGVLITHSPPFGIADQQADGTHDGSLMIKKIIKQRQPRLHLCGHIHHSWGRSGKIGQCLIHNLGPQPNWFKIPDMS